MRGFAPAPHLETFWKKFLRTSKTFKKGLFFTSLVLKNGETPPFSIVKWLLFLLSLLKVSLKPFQMLSAEGTHLPRASPTNQNLKKQPKL